MRKIKPKRRAKPVKKKRGAKPDRHRAIIANLRQRLSEEQDRTARLRGDLDRLTYELQYAGRVALDNFGHKMKVRVLQLMAEAIDSCIAGPVPLMPHGMVGKDKYNGKVNHESA